MNFVNLTGRTIRLYRKEPDHYVVSRCFPCHRDATMVTRSSKEIRYLDGIPLVGHGWTKLDNFPSKIQGTSLIVPESAARAARNIKTRGVYDLVIPIMPLATKRTGNLHTIPAEDVLELPCITFDWYVNPDVPSPEYRVFGYQAFTWLDVDSAFKPFPDEVSPEKRATRDKDDLYEEFHVIQSRCRHVGKELLMGSDFAMLIDSPNLTTDEAQANFFSGLSMESVKSFKYTDPSLSDLVEYIENLEAKSH